MRDRLATGEHRNVPLPARTLKALSARSDPLGLLQLAIHGGLIAVAGGLVLLARGTLWIVPAAALLGVFEIALFAPLHETTHKTPFRSSWINRLVGYGAGFILGLPPEGFRLFHLAHHRHTQDAARDPELIGAKPLTRRRYAWVLTGLPYWRAQIAGLVRAASGRCEAPWIGARDHDRVVGEARTYAMLYAAVAVTSIVAKSDLALVLWVFPVILGQPLLRWVLLAEHAGCAASADRLANTRTTLTMRAFRLLFWNANYHSEHHLAPGVPFHALPKLHALVGAELAVVAAGYPAAHASIRHRLAKGGRPV